MGNIRTALFNYLFARQQEGRFILRIEDTDLARSSSEFESQLMQDLKWFGLDWDEGPDVGGAFGAYRQSERLSIYGEFSRRLMDQGVVYRCFCTAADLGQEREAAKLSGGRYIYSGRCRHRSRDEVDARLGEGKPFTLRFQVRSGQVQWLDIVRGVVDWQCDLLGDFVIVKSDGWPVYNFAVVVDDLSMKITHVVRGDGHLSNTPRQLLLFEALQSAPPQYAHLSTILGSDGTKLSKRHGATSLGEFREAGYLPEALFNFLALLGWAPADGQTELLARADLLAQFSLERVGKAPAIFDPQKLNWMNRHYLRSIERERVIDLARQRLVQSGRLRPGREQPGERAWLATVVDAMLSYLDAIGQVVEVTSVIFEYDTKRASSAADVVEVLGDESSMGVVRTLSVKLEGSAPVALEAFKRAVAETKNETGMKGKALFHPIRVALTLRSVGPDLDKLVPIFESGAALDLPHPIPGIESRLKMFLGLTEVGG